MGRGGYRPGAGRPKGSGKPSESDGNSETRETPWELPVAYMLRVMNDPTADAARRDRAAIALAPYLHRKQGERGAREEAESRASAAEKGTDWDGLLD